MSGKKQQPTSRPKGRPPKGAPPALPGEEVDRLLVFGEVVTCDDGASQTVVYPSYRDLAERFQVSTTLVAKYSKDHNCIRRREQAKARIQAQADQKLVELRATAVALSKDDELRIIDGFLAGFEAALAEGRVRFDNPGDFNTMLRLKQFVMGGADSRQEIHASLSLEDIQARHQRMIRVVGDTSAAVCGELPEPASGVVIDAESHAREDAAAPPRAATDGAAGDLNVHFERPSRAPSRQSAADALPAPAKPVLDEPDHGGPAEARQEGAGARDGAAFDEPGRQPRVLPRAPDETVGEPVGDECDRPTAEVNTVAGVQFPVHGAAAADEREDADGR